MQCSPRLPPGGPSDTNSDDAKNGPQWLMCPLCSHPKERDSPPGSFQCLQHSLLQTRIDTVLSSHATTAAQLAAAQKLHLQVQLQLPPCHLNSPCRVTDPRHPPPEPSASTGPTPTSTILPLQAPTPFSATGDSSSIQPNQKNILPYQPSFAFLLLPSSLPPSTNQGNS